MAFPKIGPLMDEAKAEVLAFSAFPRAHWAKIWSTNPLERLNKEVKRRARVVGIFPNDRAVVRLVSAVLIDIHDERQSGDRRYLSESSMALLDATSDTEPNAGDREPRVGTEDHLHSPPRGGGTASGLAQDRHSACRDTRSGGAADTHR